MKREKRGAVSRRSKLRSEKMIREDLDNNDAVAASFVYILLYCIYVNVPLVHRVYFR